MSAHPSFEPQSTKLSLDDRGLAHSPDNAFVGLILEEKSTKTPSLRVGFSLTRPPSPPSRLPARTRHVKVEQTRYRLCAGSPPKLPNFAALSGPDTP